MTAGQEYDGWVTTKVLLAWPRGYCAGVDRAVETVERLLAAQGPPVYVRKQIVHNLHVVRDLEAKGAVFVEEETEVPSGATVVLSAHGVAPTVHANAAARGLSVIDATCPLVTNVHLEAVKEPARRSDVVLVIGSDNSSNSKRLAEVAREMGTPAYLVDDEHQVDVSWLENANVVGLTSGASAPEWLVDRMIEFLKAR